MRYYESEDPAHRELAAIADPVVEDMVTTYFEDALRGGMMDVHID